MRTALLAVILVTPGFAQQEQEKETWLPSVFGSHMVLQRDQDVPIWGWDKPGQKVTVELATESVSDREPVTLNATAGDDGSWRVTVPATPTGGSYKVTITGSKTITMTDVLFGEVWICSGQSNMAWPVNAANDPDLEKLSANFPNIRLVTVPRVGTQEPQKNFQGEWVRCSPQTVGDFSAVGYFFGRQLHQTLNVPIGLIDNAWGGSACEAWINRDLLKKDGRFEPLLEGWRNREANFDKDMAAYEEQLKKHRVRAAEARKAGKRVPRGPRSPKAMMTGNQRPANIYNGVLKPTIGYGIRGAIWYQGESNASRAYQYRDLFPYMIQTWRDEWGQGDFPFYWVQLADFRAEKTEPADSDWAELREAQTMTMSKLKNTGEAVIIDIGEGRDIHPRNKQDVAKRLARWALAKDYGVDIACQSPTYKSMEKQGNKIILTFDHVGPTLYAFDVNQPIGFTIAGEDKVFHNATAKMVKDSKNQIEVWCDAVSDPVAVRYAWADNPIANLYSRNGLPATPFRTDDWKGVTAGRQTR